MQRLPLIVKTRKGWSRKAPNNSTAGRRRAAVVLILLIFVVGCDGQEAPSAEVNSEQASSASVSEAESADSLRRQSGDQSVADRLRDASLAAEVQLALMDSRELRAFRLDPVAVDGRVVLQGDVETLAQRERAAAIAAGVDGVEEVINEIASAEQPDLAASGDETSGNSLGDEDSPLSGASSDEQAEADATDEDAASSEQEAQGTYHTVRSGENLWVIARSYGVSIAQIRRLNDLSSDALQPGQRLRVR